MAIFDELMSVGKVLQEAGKIEQYQQILEAQQQLLEMQKKIAELEKDNQKLKEKFELQEKLVPNGNVYWTENNGLKDGPFCTCCWDSERHLIRLHTVQISDTVHCPKCKTTADPGRAVVYIPNR